MVKPAPGQPQAPPQDLDSLLARREALLRELHDVEAKVAKRKEMIERREAEVQKMRGSVQQYGDVVSPINASWDVAR